MQISILKEVNQKIQTLRIINHRTFNQMENRLKTEVILMKKISQQKDGEDDKSVIAGNTSSENMELDSNSHKSSDESKQEQNESNVELKAKLQLREI